MDKRYPSKRNKQLQTKIQTRPINTQRQTDS